MLLLVLINLHFCCFYYCSNYHHHIIIIIIIIMTTTTTTITFTFTFTIINNNRTGLVSPRDTADAVQHHHHPQHTHPREKRRPRWSPHLVYECCINRACCIFRVLTPGQQVTGRKGQGRVGGVGGGRSGSCRSRSLRRWCVGSLWTMCSETLRRPFACQATPRCLHVVSLLLLVLVVVVVVVVVAVLV